MGAVATGRWRARGGRTGGAPVLPPTGAEPAPPAPWLRPSRGCAQVHVPEQAGGPYRDRGGARPRGEGREPQFTVAEHVEAGQFDFDPFRYVHGQVAEQRDGGDVDHVAVDGYLPQVEM